MLKPPPRRALAALVGLAACAVSFTAAWARSPSAGAPSPAAASESAAAKPTIVLVHGAFADASSWSGVISRLQSRGYKVAAPPNPLRGVAYDAAYVRAFLHTIAGPIVLVAHSYGGVVITNAATGNRHVKALVYVAAFAPRRGESVGELGARVPGGMVGPRTLDIRPYPTPDGGQGLEATIKVGVFHHVFAADLPRSLTRVMAVSQRPASLTTLTDPSGRPAWRTTPSWYIVPGKDLVVGTRLERFMARRMHAHTTEVAGASHVVMLSHPRLTTRVIVRAVRATD
jgi:pimeloyl-ACP methyl ester carboxylesterase